MLEWAKKFPKQIDQDTSRLGPGRECSSLVWTSVSVTAARSPRVLAIGLGETEGGQLPAGNSDNEETWVRRSWVWIPVPARGLSRWSLDWVRLSNCLFGLFLCAIKNKFRSDVKGCNLLYIRKRPATNLCLLDFLACLFMTCRKIPRISWLVMFAK